MIFFSKPIQNRKFGQPILMIMRLIFLLSLVCYSVNLWSGVDCPGDVVLTCPQTVADLPSNGVYGNGAHAGIAAKYIDYQSYTSCNDIELQRTWYIDLNSNDLLDGNEPSCVQHISYSVSDQPLSIQFPENVTMQCAFDDSVDLGSPSYSAGFCKNVAVSHEDKIYGDSLTSCYKILRTYTVVSMCINPFDGSWIQDEVIEHVQVIKVVDDEAPQIQGCEDRVVSVGKNCDIKLALNVQAFDNEDCSSGDLSWTIKVDLWNDGSVDYTYGREESGDFYLKPTISGESIAIELPVAVGEGHHSIEYKVRDACGNYGACIQKIETKDLKPPTPYCNAPLFLTLNGQGGDSLIVHVDIFNNGAIDNCGGEVSLSFEKDSIVQEKVIKCGQAGFQFNRIWHTDRSGNKDFCGARYLVFDNGSCGARQTSHGRIKSYVGSSDVWKAVLRDRETVVMSTPIQADTFAFEEHPLYEGMYATLEPISSMDNTLSLGSFIRLRNYLIGKDSLDRSAMLAADIDDDGRVSNADLFRYRDYMLGLSDVTNPYRLYTHDLITRVDRYPLSAYTGVFDFSIIGVGSIDPASPSTRDQKEVFFTKKRTKNGYEYSTDSDVIVQGVYIRSAAGNQIGLSPDREVYKSTDQSTLLWVGNTTAKSLTIEAAQAEDIIIRMVNEKGNEFEANILNKEVEILSSNNGGIDVLGDVQSVYVYTIEGKEVSFDMNIYSPNHRNIKLDKNGFYIISIRTRDELISKKIHITQ